MVKENIVRNKFRNLNKHFFHFQSDTGHNWLSNILCACDILPAWWDESDHCHLSTWLCQPHFDSAVWTISNNSILPGANTSEYARLSCRFSTIWIITKLWGKNVNYLVHKDINFSNSLQDVVFYANKCISTWQVRYKMPLQLYKLGKTNSCMER